MSREQQAEQTIPPTALPAVSSASSVATAQTVAPVAAAQMRGQPTIRLTTRLSMNELTERILEMAQTGIYRESLFEAFRPVATKKQIKSAIALAKQFGLHSEASLRDAELGTYYQVDVRRVQSFQAAIADSLVLSAGDDMAQKVMLATRIVKLMLLVSGASAIALLFIGGGYIITGKGETAALWWTSALCAGGIWLWQKNVAKPLL
ncbi:MAG: hypothetical protein AAF703_09340 [Cyanobacteria bacterium P01_D01_bin.105]